MTKLLPHYVLVLENLSTYTYEGEPGFVGFSIISHNTGLDRKTVRRVCRALARKGFAEYMRGLWNDEGPCGAGYGITHKGLELLELPR